jgi:hypothetical protein
MDINQYVSPILSTVREAHACPPPEEYGTGHDPRDWGRVPYGSLPGAHKFNLPRMTERDILEMIREKDAKNAWLTVLCDRANSPVKNQQRTNYCWINSVVRCVEVRRVAQGLPYVELSPASVGAIIKRYRNEGGWGGEGLKLMTEIGVAPADLWPCNAIDPQYDNAASREARRRFIVSKWMEFDRGDKLAVYTAIVNDFPASLGIPAWGHEVAGTRLAANRGRIQVVIDNSWSTAWGDNGRGLLTGRYADFDDACAPVNAGASDV